MSQTTSPMTRFLQRLAGAVRDVVARDEAVHVDMDTARELWIVQGFPWESAPYARRIRGAAPIDPGRIESVAAADCELVQVSPSDFARGCLILSAFPGEPGKMAELAALAPSCIDLDSAVGPRPWIGSDAGTAAAWELMAKEMRRISPPLGLMELSPRNGAMDRLIRGLAEKCISQCCALQDYLEKQPSRKLS